MFSSEGGRRVLLSRPTISPRDQTRGPINASLTSSDAGVPCRAPPHEEDARVPELSRVLTVSRTDIDPIEWSHRIVVSEIHAALEPARVVRFAELLDREPLIRRALHERPAVVLVQAPSIDTPLLEDLADKAWAEAV
jgi:hypothetical protein